MTLSEILTHSVIKRVKKLTRCNGKILSGIICEEKRLVSVGDYVEIRNTETTAGINRKLIPKYRGPYVVKKVLDYDRYVIADVDDFQLIQRPYTGVFAPDQMRPYLHA